MGSKMNKNIGPFNFFNKDWFAKNQAPLLWLLNSKPTKLLTRYLMRIRPSDIPLHEPILKLMPNGFLWGLEWLPGGQPQLRYDFRTHNKYAKRLYFAAKPLWSLMHAFDMRIANPFIPVWNLGFDDWPSQPYYPDPDPETNTVDGYIQGIDATSWANARATADTSNDNGTLSNIFNMKRESNSTWYVTRSVTIFDTSALGAGSTVLSANYNIYLSTIDDAETDHPGDLVLVECTITGTSITSLSTSDWGSFGTTSFSASFYDLSSVSGGYNQLALNATGLSNVNVSGITKLGLRGQNDLDGDAHAPSLDSSVQMYFADYADVTRDPKLTGTYTPAAESYAGMMF